MTSLDRVAEIVRDTLTCMPLVDGYVDEQRDLQPIVLAALHAALHQAFPLAQLETIASVGGTGKPNLKLLGTSFWPDIVVTEGTEGRVAIEVKLIRARQSPSKALAEAIGQAVIYSVQYPRVFVFAAHCGRDDRRYHDEDVRLRRRLLDLNIELVIRVRSNTHTPD